MKHLGLRLFTAVLMSWSLGLPCAFALEHWYLPVENQLRTLRVENPGSSPQGLWISGPIEKPADNLEVYYEVPARAMIEVELEEFDIHPWIHLKAKDQSPLKLSVMEKTKKILALEKGNSNNWQKTFTAASELILFNTSGVSQNVSVETNSKEKSYELAAFEKMKLPTPAFSTVKIRGSQRLVTMSASKNAWSYLEIPSTPLTLKPVTAKKDSYFLFANSDRSQSFVVRIDNEELKEQARNQIADQRKYPKKLLIATIGLGSGGNNRDWFHANRSPWSWYVKDAVTFADFASQECDGSPEFVDEFVLPWTQGLGTICFWSYKVLRELSFEQVQTGLPE